ncbi:hypothetical protein LCGC14_2368990 [marine sediment metagenome]|uniref:Uncharacterized protein n=1 Tax=marine sediment metagenome TaxID=412755 RepID=A0A0F9CRI6_9ZZZZ
MNEDRLSNQTPTYIKLAQIIKTGFLLSEEGSSDHRIVDSVGKNAYMGTPDDGNGSPALDGDGFDITLMDGSKVRLMLFQIFDEEE